LLLVGEPIIIFPFLIISVIAVALSKNNKAL
jgi:hypothetical protein